jgi:REP element-mobilizing transposase RayT
MDRLLGEARSGPQFLRQSEIASLVIEAIHFAEQPLGRYDLHSYVVMPNHVHLLVTPKADVSKLLRSLKGFTARRANQFLRRAGKAFWQEESYDHWVRNDEEFERITRYIVFNPVRAGLVATPEDYPWSGGAVRQNRTPAARPER